MTNFKFKLGEHLHDRITGYKGYVTIITTYSTGMAHYNLQRNGLDKDGKPFESRNPPEVYLERTDVPMLDMFVQGTANFSIGDEVKSITNGHAGVVDAISYYASGCITYGVRQTKKGSTTDYTWLNENESRLIKAQKIDLISNKKISGFVQSPPRM